MELRAKSRLKPTRMRHSSSLNQNGNFDSLTVWNEIVLRYRIQAFLVFMALRVQPKACLFVSRVSAFECLLPDELNPYLQKSPGYSRARWYVLGFNKSLSTSFSPCLRPLIGLERWVFEVFTLVASGIWLSHLWVDLLGRGAFHTPPLITKSVVALGNQGMLCWVCMGSQDIVYYL